MSKARICFSPMLALLTTVLICGLMSLLPAQAQTANKRLILKDGSYQIVTQYKVLGARVRYFSAERADWEEMPSKLVDWKATEKWAKEHQLPGGIAAKPPATSPAEAEAAAIDNQEQSARAEENARTPQVQPGLRLPDQTGVWVLDTFRARPELVELVQNSGNLNPRTGHNVTPEELTSSGALKKSVQFDGATSKVQLHVDLPVFYVSLSLPPGKNDNADSLSPAFTVDTHGASLTDGKYSYSSPSSRYVIVRVWNNMRRNYRELTPFRLNPSGNTAPGGNVIPVKAQILPGARWMKLTPSTTLTIGDYALMEILGPREVNLSLWDFRVDPQGPDNMNTIVPLQQASQ